MKEICIILNNDRKNIFLSVLYNINYKFNIYKKKTKKQRDSCVYVCDTKETLYKIYKRVEEVLMDIVFLSITWYWSEVYIVQAPKYITIE